MFSLEELMKTAAPPSTPSKKEEPSDQLWNMSGGAPLFGTAYDQALLTTPLKTELASMDAMTVPSQAPVVRRWLPLVVAIAGGSAVLAGGAWWAFAPREPEVRPSEASLAIAPAEAPPAPAPAPPEPPPAAETETVAAAVAPAADADPAPGGEDPAADEADEKEAETTQKNAPTAKRSAPKAPRSAPKAAFNTGAARNALQSAAAKAASCKGASGKGKVQLTFAPSGRVSSAQLVSGPFAGTSAGSCVLRYFKAARVPAFAGGSQTVAKSFKIP